MKKHKCVNKSIIVHCNLKGIERKWMKSVMIITLFLNLWISTIVAIWIKNLWCTIAQSKRALNATIEIVKHVAIFIKVTCLDCTFQRFFWLIRAGTNLSFLFAFSKTEYIHPCYKHILHLKLEPIPDWALLGITLYTTAQKLLPYSPIATNTCVLSNFCTYFFVIVYL